MAPRKLNPPFRGDHVGSFLRPKELLEERKKYKDGVVTAERLREVENKHIAELVKREQELGVQSITDGEFHREVFHIEFLKQLSGVVEADALPMTESYNQKFQKFQQKPKGVAVASKIQLVRSIELANYEYLKSQLSPDSSAIAKITIPSPNMLYFRTGRSGISTEAYPTLDEFFDDLAAVYKAEIDGLYKAGCRFIQFDDPYLSFLCDPDMRASAAERFGGEEGVKTLPLQFTKLLNACIDGRPEDLCIGIHVCRGNYRSQWFAQGGYEPIAETLFRELNVDVYFLEWENERSGDFAPLRLLPPEKIVCLGLISTKFPEMEKKEDIIKRIHEAAKYAPLDQLAVGPQCGFSSAAEGNEITPEVQWEKMKLVYDVARAVWPDDMIQ